MKPYNFFEILALVTLLALTVFTGISCGKAQADTNQKLEGIAWVLHSYGDPAKLTPVLPDKEVSIAFDKDKKEVGGNGGVNGYGGKYELNGSKLYVKDVVHTLIASTNPAMNEQETAFFKILESAESFKIDNNQLTITGSEGTLVFYQK
jgi:heat shock protein HslJ